MLASVSQAVFCRREGRPTPTSAGHDSCQTLHSYPSFAFYCESYTTQQQTEHLLLLSLWRIITFNPFLYIQLISTLLMLCTSDIYTLINYVGFINYLFYGITVAGQIVLRIKQPDMYRPIKVKTQTVWVWQWKFEVWQHCTLSSR